ncbi:MAG: ComF family protein [Pseudomonadota bacterium]
MHKLLPQDCVLCGVTAGSSMVCCDCLRTLPYHNLQACPRCALPTADGAICGRCLVKPPIFERAVAVFDYCYPLAELLHAFKYGGQFAVGKFLANALVERVQKERWPELIVPMPLYPSRLAERGFNQAAEIARGVSCATDLPFSLSTLVKIRDTAPQVGLPWKERRANVKGAFACKADFSGMRVAIVDDVMTTGASLDEAAKSIKQAGASEVVIWVVARTLPENSL